MWLAGHSSGAAEAQLLALRLERALGRGAGGGALLFNSDRTGSTAFARHYDAILGNRTLRFGYGHGAAADGGGGRLLPAASTSSLPSPPTLLCGN